MKLKTKKQILSNAKPYYKITCPDKYFRDMFLSEMQISGIYFLIRNKKIIYIGKSIDLDMRLYNHKREKYFHQYYFEEHKKENLDIIKSKYIYKFLPEENKYLNLNKVRMKLN